MHTLTDIDIITKFDIWELKKEQLLAEFSIESNRPLVKHGFSEGFLQSFEKYFDNCKNFKIWPDSNDLIIFLKKHKQYGKN